MGNLAGIAFHRERHGPIIELQKVNVTCEAGIEGDFRGNPGKRQVTILAKEAWNDTCKDLNIFLPWTKRRANLLVEGIDLVKSTGKTIFIGNAAFEITGATEPCSRMDEISQGLKLALQISWRCGVISKVIKGGKINVGDQVCMK